MAEINALRRRDKSLLDMKRECSLLNQSSTETNERRVANRTKDVENQWEMLEQHQSEYLNCLGITAADPTHANDLSDAFTETERVKALAKDYLWKAEDNRIQAEEERMSRVEKEKHKAVLLKLRGLFVQEVRSLQSTGEDIMIQFRPEVMLQADVMRIQYERYKDGFSKVTDSYHVYINKEIDQDAIEVASNTLNDAKRSFLGTEASILTYISACNSRQHQPMTDNSSAAEKVRVQRLAAPRFNGSIKEYASFKRNYKAIMENAGYNNIQLAYQLKSESLPEETRMFVKNITEYEEIWNRLDEQYGDVGELVAIVIKDISLLKVVDDVDDKGLINIVDKVEQGYQDLRCIGKEAQLANVITIKTIESKLPRVMLREWWKFSEKYEAREHSDDHVGKLRDLIKFLSMERSKARRSLRLEADRNPKTKVKEQSYILHAKSEMVDDPCWMDGCSPDHRVRNCFKFKALSREEKGNYYRNEGLCVLLRAPYGGRMSHETILATM